jgi:hypothetical protein
VSGGYFHAVPCQPGPVCSDAKGADTLSGVARLGPDSAVARCRRQSWPTEGAPETWLVFEPEMLEGLRSLLPATTTLFTGRVDLGRSHSTTRRELKSVPMMTGRGQLMEPMAALQAGDCVTATACGSL